MLKQNYNKTTVDYPSLSSFTCFVKTISGRHLPLKEITSWFEKLVDKKDYRRAEKEEILNWMLTI